MTATIGISATAVLLNGQAAPYFLCVGLTGACACISLERRNLLFSQTCLLPWIVFFWLVLATTIRYALNSNVSLASFPVDPFSELTKIIAILIILLVIISAGIMSEWVFQRTMALVALLHGVLLLYGLSNGQATLRILANTESVTRFSGADFKTAAWAEIALGTIMAATLSRRLWVGITIIPIALYTILAADMRTTLLASVVMMLILLVGRIGRIKHGKQRQLVWVGSAIFIILIGLAYRDHIVAAVSDILLLNDRHRGISSGFSGRFDNFAHGWAAFLEHVILGAGFNNPIVNYTHSGYILTFAQMGAPLALLLLPHLFLAGTRALRYGDFVLLSVITGLLFFYLGQPRNINFQVCPLLGLVACARVLLGNIVRRPAKRKVAQYEYASLNPV
ncbi:O-antigen ligase family protein [Rubellimicrobium rubrum]|uniref:O-antigen ligase family protein n=1 Tax=Rubellimicrobium rubrum TaxID=2585369 RepID=A0A5C4N2Y7_9RHOB|nr:O-antigen ligase family protein [Rubellimicrobium rubrum]TNC52298.1 O-antigen ligase family protein [Rubellimicrobium rubrum]